MTDLGDSRTDAEIEELCQLLLGMDRARLLAALERLEDRRAFADLQSHTLAEAMRLALARDQAFVESMGTMISKGVVATVERDAASFGRALAPAMGPAIRNSVRLMLKGFISSIETAVDQKLSLRSLRWRFEAWRSGRSFAEVVFRHTLLFRVEHVFLVHREGGVQLLHAAAPGVTTREPELIAAMLTAIQDFVRDAFHSDVGDTLDSFAVGDLTVGIESGSHAVIAAVVRGEAPSRVRLQLREALDRIESATGRELAHFDGQVDLFEVVRPELESCLLQSELPTGRTARKKKRVLPWVLLGAAVLALVWMLLGWIEAHDTRGRFATFLAELRQEPGIVVTEVEPTPDGWLVHGMRDPLGREIDAIAAQHRVGRQVRHAMQPYHALHPAFIAQRATLVLAPPPGVTVEVRGDRLALAGAAEHEWCVRARAIASTVAGVAGVDDSGLTDIDDAAWREAAARLAAQPLPLSALQRGFGDEHRSLSELAESLDRHGRKLGRATSLQCVVRAPDGDSVPLAVEAAQAVVSRLDDVLPLRVRFLGPAGDQAPAAVPARLLTFVAVAH